MRDDALEASLVEHVDAVSGQILVTANGRGGHYDNAAAGLVRAAGGSGADAASA